VARLAITLRSGQQKTSNYSLAALSTTEHKVYTLIVRRFLAQFLSPGIVYQSTLVSVDCEGEKTECKPVL
jgi:DNA topoisomerase IA